MKTKHRLIDALKRVWGILFTCTTCQLGFSQDLFDAGSDGSFGPIEITENTTLDIPDDGIFHATTVTVAAGATLKFNKNARNTPVYILATGDLTVAGVVDVSGKPGNGLFGGPGGPGGFAGGNGSVMNVPNQSGFGPGGGVGGSNGRNIPSGSYRTRPSVGQNSSDGQIYGNALIFPLIGGSGGAGDHGVGGGGGGGAILLASNTRIEISTGGQIQALGGPCGNNGCGSGGAIRLVSPLVAGGGTLNVASGPHGFGNVAGHGRIRIDSIFSAETRNLSATGVSSVVSTLGGVMATFPAIIPALRILQAAGQDIGEDVTDATVSITDDIAEQTVRLRATDFNAIVTARVVIIPETTGAPVNYDVEIDNTSNNPAEVTVDVIFPVNTINHVQAWTVP